MFVIEFRNGGFFKQDQNTSCMWSEATRYPTKEGAWEVAKDYAWFGPTVEDEQYFYDKAISYTKEHPDRSPVMLFPAEKELNGNNVYNTFLSSLYKDSEVDGDEIRPGLPVRCTLGSNEPQPLIVVSIMIRIGFHPERLEENRKTVAGFLSQIADESFFCNGMTFLRFCQSINESVWGEHRNCDELIAMGVGLGYVEILGREMMSVLLGGVPYINIKETRQRLQEIARS